MNPKKKCESKRIKVWVSPIVRMGFPGKNSIRFGVRGIVGSLAKGYPKILSRHTLRTSFSLTAKKKQSSIISQNMREWIRIGVCLRGLLWQYDVTGKKNRTQNVPATRASQSISETPPPSLHTTGTHYEIGNQEQCILKLKPTRLAKDPLVSTGNKTKKACDAHSHSCFLGPPPLLEAATIPSISVSFHAEPRRHTRFYILLRP